MGHLLDYHVPCWPMTIPTEGEQMLARMYKTK
jgi:hypothetical protein